MEALRHETSASMPFSQLADGVWVLNRPLKAGPVDLGHRMTVVRLASTGLWVHSPVALDDEVRAGLDSLGEVEYLIAPSTFHDLYWAPWFAAYPQARFCAAPGVREEHPELPFTDVLDADIPAARSGDLEHVQLGGMPKINESVFLHTPSKTLIVADMAFNHDRGVNFATGLVLRMTGCYGQFGVSRLYKLFIGDRKGMRRSVDEVLDWDFERIVMGHGHIVERDGRRILREAYAFLRP
ncbi:MAG TPA: DUF4336 domain-containing protein [Candidatus Latescibacteria bacterium]|nr:hypothetical protein [Gemmatimonadaceae bacterium]MDP6016076.1 DUF4336 domain-containing protein [Candidatus Latescibacterota bacterium]HJP31025.1 DUF4336 domain-containing protein [Candidatus Latescibacterota bacterium]